MFDMHDVLTFYPIYMRTLHVVRRRPRHSQSVTRRWLLVICGAAARQQRELEPLTHWRLRCWGSKRHWHFNVWDTEVSRGYDVCKVEVTRQGDRLTSDDVEVARNGGLVIIFSHKRFRWTFVSHTIFFAQPFLVHRSSDHKCIET